MRWTKVMGAALAAQLSVAAVAAEVNDGLVLLPGGTVTIGSPDSERQRQADETQHQVTLSAFYVDPHEVTQKDYQAVMGTNPSHFRGDNLPVEQVTWQVCLILIFTPIRLQCFP